VKPQPSANNPRVVGGAGIQMREDAAEQYLEYKLSGTALWDPLNNGETLTLTPVPKCAKPNHAGD
jgi:hypothetical protein